MPKKAVAGEGRRSTLNVRTTEAIRKKLELAAATSGRALIHEVEHRLEFAFWREEVEALEQSMFGSPDNMQLADAIRLAVGHACSYSGESWKESKYSQDIIRATVIKTLDEMFAGHQDNPIVAEPSDRASPDEIRRATKLMAGLAISAICGRPLNAEAKAALLGKDALV